MKPTRLFRRQIDQASPEAVQHAVLVHQAIMADSWRMAADYWRDEAERLEAVLTDVLSRDLDPFVAERLR